MQGREGEGEGESPTQTFGQVLITAVSHISYTQGDKRTQWAVLLLQEGVGLPAMHFGPFYARSVVMSRIESRLRERDDARKAAVAARRLEKEKESRVEETSEFFSQQFSSQVKGMHERGLGGRSHVHIPYLVVFCIQPLRIS